MSTQDPMLNLPPVPKSIGSWGPLTILQHYLHMWPPQDARLDEEYMTTNRVLQTDSKAMMNLAEGIELSVISKDPKENSLDVGVFLVANQADFEITKNAIDKKLADWECNNSPDSVFDPISGDLYKVEPLAGLNAPVANRALYVRLRFSLEVSDHSYVLSYAAWDVRQNVLYYQTIEHEHPGYLMRRAMHELFGNHLLRGNEGPFLEGIAYLIQGRKVSLCQDHPKPTWLKFDQLKTLTKLKENNLIITLLGTLSLVLTYIAPLILLVYGVIVRPVRSLTEGQEISLSMLGGALLGIILCFWASRLIQKQQNVLKLKSKLM